MIYYLFTRYNVKLTQITKQHIVHYDILSHASRARTHDTHARTYTYAYTRAYARTIQPTLELYTYVVVKPI